MGMKLFRGVSDLLGRYGAGTAEVGKSGRIAVLTHSSIRPIHQGAAKDGWAGPPINRANDRPIHQWAQPTHQYGHNDILI